MSHVRGFLCSAGHAFSCYGWASGCPHIVDGQPCGWATSCAYVVDGQPCEGKVRLGRRAVV